MNIIKYDQDDSYLEHKKKQGIYSSVYKGDMKAHLHMMIFMRMMIIIFIVINVIIVT